MDLIYIIIIIILAIFFLFMCQRQEAFKKEHFDDIKNQISSIINDFHKTDLTNMITLGNIASNILTNNDTLNFPTNTEFTNMTLNGDLSSTGNVIITGDLEVDGIVYTKNEDILYPTYMIISLDVDKKNIPLGWAPCDGNKYRIKKTTDPAGSLNYIIDNDNGTQTANYSILSANSVINIPFIMKIA
jgi:hypothetical protein